MDSITVHDFMRVTYRLSDLNDSVYLSLHTRAAIRDDMQQVVELLRKCELNAASAVASIQALRLIEQFCEGDSASRPSPQQNELFKIAVESVCAAAFSEAQRTRVLRLHISDVSENLRTLPERINLTETQTRLHNEAILCIECQAFRAAMVMGWNLAFDCIRHWVFTHKLAEFNNALTTKFRNDHATPITRYEEFFTRKLGERQFIECLADQQSGPIIGGNSRDDLCQHLRRRNDYAHPNFKNPTISQTNAFIEELLGIVDSAPFSSSP